MTKRDSRVQSRVDLILLFLMAMSPNFVAAQPVCDAAALTDQQVKDIIDKARKTRTDLAAPFPKYRWSVRRQGCHYAYIEHGLPEAPDYRQSFKINQHGVIVDGDTSSLKCPEKVLTETELAEIVATERKKRRDLPPALPSFKSRVQRLRCLYLYFEYALPERRGDFQAFTIDPLGEVMDFYRSQPY